MQPALQKKLFWLGKMQYFDGATPNLHMRILCIYHRPTISIQWNLIHTRPAKLPATANVVYNFRPAGTLRVAAVTRRNATLYGSVCPHLVTG